MASPARINCLNLGTQTVGLAEFQTTANGGVVLNAFRLNEILADPSAEQSRLPQTRLAIAEIKGALKIKGGPVNYAISGQNLFARFVKLPTVAEEKVEQIISFEAQQNVPFPIDEVVWDYQLVAGGKNGSSSLADSQVEVVLVAIKNDLLEDLNAATESSGFRTQVVDAAPMALYNAFRYNYSDIGGCSLLIDLGARTTNLIFIEQGKVFSRSIPIGGNTITQQLAKEFQESFAAAEQRKRREGYVSLGGSYADDKNPEIAKTAKLIRNTMTRLHAEISRSISFYRAQQSGSPPQSIYLCGGTANLPYLREFFSEKFNLPIEFFNPLRNVTVSQRVSIEEVTKSAHQLGELVGLSLRSLHNCPMELNLRPASVVNAQRIASRRPYLIAAGLCLLATLAGWWLYNWRAADVKSQVLGKVDQKVTAMQGYANRFKQIDAERAALAARWEPLSEAIDARQFWPQVLGELNARLPKQYIWITLLEPTSNGKPITFGDPTKSLAPLGSGGGATPRPGVRGAATAAKPAQAPVIDGLHIKGLYLYNDKGYEVVADFVRNLAQSPLFDVDTKNINSTMIARTQQTDHEWAFEYELQLKFKPPFHQPL